MGKYEISTPEAKPYGRRGGARGQAAPPPMVRPLWTSAAITSQARGMPPHIVDAIMGPKLSALPAATRYRLCALLKASATDNAIAQKALSDIEELMDALKPLVEGHKYLDTPTSASLVLAAYLGADSTAAQMEKDAVTDLTVKDDESETAQLVVPSQREIPQLLAYAASELTSSDGVVLCNCGKPASNQVKRGWNGGPAVQFLECAQRRCRFYLNMSAYPLLREFLQNHSLTKVPCLFCPKHPEQQIRISVRNGGENEEEKLAFSCGWFKRTPGQGPEFCPSSEIAGAENGAFTGLPIWSVLDMA